MQKKIVYVGIGVAAISIAVFFVFFQFPTTQINTSSLDLDFSYEEANSNIRSNLLSFGINMSKPLKFSTQADISQYCNFLTDPKKQSLVQYCTSTELKDRKGNFLGDINMVGSPTAPGLVITALQSDPFLQNLDDVKIVFSEVINETVCQCWQQEKPGGYATISDMVNALHDFQISGKQPSATTHTVPLGSEHFEMDITTNQNGYEWKLLVAK